MRLIDADQFLENAKNELNCEGKCCECEHYNLCDIYKMVEKQPTAYDVDKVVEQLEEKARGSWGYPSVMEFDDVTRIVKSGGID